MLFLIAACCAYKLYFTNHEPRRVRVISKKTAQDTVLQWADDAAARPARQRELLRAVSTFSLRPHNAVCYIALEVPVPFFTLPSMAKTFETRAVAMFHAVPRSPPEPRDKLHLWTVACIDDECGMMLFKSLVSSNLSVSCEYTVEPRWRMEKLYSF